MFGFNFGSKSTICVNGVNIVGKNISVKNGRLIVDGVEHSQSDDIFRDKVITIHVKGDVEKLESISGAVHVNGNVKSLSSTSGDVEVSGDVENVKTVSGDVQGKNIGKAQTVSGDIST